MTTRHDEWLRPADVLATLPYAAALSHLRGAAAAVHRLLADVHPSNPMSDKLLEASQAIHTAHQKLTDGVQRSQR